MPFNAFGLHPSLVQAVKELGYSKPEIRKLISLNACSLMGIAPPAAVGSPNATYAHESHASHASHASHYSGR